MLSFLGHTEQYSDLQREQYTEGMAPEKSDNRLKKTMGTGH